jgi:hypothetical protein
VTPADGLKSLLPEIFDEPSSANRHENQAPRKNGNVCPAGIQAKESDVRKSHSSRLAHFVHWFWNGE